jgi:catechol 2,3-dioxygenase-like lactoylglutathione lyase family enzyme
MTIKNALAGLATADLKRAETWYTALIGRVPDSKPMAEVFEYQFPTGGWLQVFADKDRAGHGSLTMVVEDFDAALVKLDGADIAHEAPSRGDYVDTVIFADPDGNRIVFAKSQSGENKAAA